MTDMLRVGRVGRPHGVCGAFRVRDATERAELLEPGAILTVEGIGEARVMERKGTAEHPIVSLEGVDPEPASGRALLVPRDRVRSMMRPGEWLPDELVGCVVKGVGRVTGVRFLPSVDVLEVEPDRGGDTILVPMVSDAILSLDPAAGEIEANLEFLGIGGA